MRSCFLELNLGVKKIFLLIGYAPVTAKWMQTDHHRVMEQSESSFSVYESLGKRKGEGKEEMLCCLEELFR